MTEEVKAWLKRAYKIDMEINNLIQERDKTFLRAISPQNGCGKERVQTTKQNNSERKYVEYADYEDIIDGRIDELYSTKAEIFRTINKVENSVFRNVLLMRYIRFMRWEEIAEELGYDLRYLFKIHGKAVEAVGRILFEEEKK